MVEVVGLLLNAGVSDPVILCAAALHDTIEDTFDEAVRTALVWEIQERVGKDVLDLVYKLTKPHMAEREERHRFMMEGIASDWRVAIIKLADRTSNIANFHATQWRKPNKASYLVEAREIWYAADKVSLDPVPLDELEAYHLLLDRLEMTIQDQEKLMSFNQVPYGE